MDVKIETPRLTLRPWRESDIEALTSGLNDLEVAKWLVFVPHPYTASHASDWIERCRKLGGANAQPVAYEFAIERKPDGAVVGGVSLSKIDWNTKTAGGGIWIARRYHGHGYGSEAFAAKIRFAFRDLGMTKLINGYFGGNENSAAMQRKLGYRQVGKVANRCMADGRAVTEHVTELLRSDWEDRAET